MGICKTCGGQIVNGECKYCGNTYEKPIDNFISYRDADGNLKREVNPFYDFGRKTGVELNNFVNSIVLLKSAGL